MRLAAVGHYRVLFATTRACSPPVGRVYASLPPAQRGTSLVINGDPKGKTFLYTCGRTVFIRDIDVSPRTTLCPAPLPLVSQNKAHW